MTWVAVVALLVLLGLCAVTISSLDRFHRRRIYDEKVGLSLEGLVALLPTHLRNREYTAFVIGPSVEGTISVGLIYDDRLVRKGNPANVGLDFDPETGVLVRIHEDGVGLGYK